MPLFNLIFLALRWPWVREFVGFIRMHICFPTQQKKVIRKHPININSIVGLVPTIARGMRLFIVRPPVLLPSRSIFREGG